MIKPVRRAVITGIGVVAPGAPNVVAYENLLRAGRTATKRITMFDPSVFRSQVAAECDFDPYNEGLTEYDVYRMDRAAQLAVVSAREAVADSGLESGEIDPGLMGVSLGSAVGQTMALESEYVVVSDRGKRWEVDYGRISPHCHQYLVPSSLAVEVAWSVGAEGPVRLVSNGCTAGLDSVGYGAQLIENGQAEVVVAGATDAPISPITVACFDAIRATTPFEGDPAEASRPFDATRDGFVLGEGAAILVLEDAEHAQARGAHIYCEVAGFASRSNAYHMTGLRVDGVEMAEAIRVALSRASVVPESVDYVNAHGSGTMQNDRHETAAIKRSLGEHARKVPMSSIKSMVGHSLGAIGSIELVACVLAIRHGFVPPTANLRTPDPACDLDYVPIASRSQTVKTVLSIGSGFGGFQSAVVLSGHDA